MTRHRTGNSLIQFDVWDNEGPQPWLISAGVSDKDYLVEMSGDPDQVIWILIPYSNNQTFYYQGYIIYLQLNTLTYVHSIIKKSYKVRFSQIESYITPHNRDGMRVYWGSSLHIFVLKIKLLSSTNY